jgi:hypothetical protein
VGTGADDMAERKTNVSQFRHAEFLQRELARATEERDKATAKLDELAKEHDDAQTRMLEEHGVTLGQLQTTLGVVVVATEVLPKLVERVEKLEHFKGFLAGIAASFTFIGTLIGAAATFIWRR